ncbi:ABC-2 transporter permease [bacterium]|nr:ABC-2 transporter permease [bacterium]
MAGLLEKDIRLIWGNRQSLLLFFALAVVLGFSQDGTFILGYFPFVIIILIINTIAYDELDNGFQFLMTLPINAKTYVREKYIFSFAGGIVSWLISATLYFAAKIVHGTQLDVISELPVIVTFLPIIILMAAFMIPMQIKFGVEKSRAVVAGICGAIGACILIFAKFAGQNGKNIFAFLDHMNGWVIVGIGIVLTAVITAISYIISVKIMKKKEF